MRADSDLAVLDAARRTHCQIVNFGVVSVARATGVAADQLLELRCECGAAGCRERIRVTCSDYDANAQILVSPPHRTTLPTMDDLIASHFIAQSRRPSALRDADVAALTPYHRALLVSDGTVTHLVEASFLERLTIDVLAEEALHIADERRSWLELDDATSVVRRRIAIRGLASLRTHALAESLLVSSRLPSEFIGRLRDNTNGLGETLVQLRLETRRELLWFGLAPPPTWAACFSSSESFLSRSYRIIVGGTPSILITECFPLDDPDTR